MAGREAGVKLIFDLGFQFGMGRNLATIRIMLKRLARS